MKSHFRFAKKTATNPYCTNNLPSRGQAGVVDRRKCIRLGGDWTRRPIAPPAKSISQLQEVDTLYG